MAIRSYIRISCFVLAQLLLVRCAQIGTLTGGKKDTFAPQPIASKMIPEVGATNFHGSQLVIPFSEFIKLNNPAETMVMIPPHAKCEARISKKTLTVSWKDTLQENTTYILYLNETVQDVTEGNDSLMQLVFSTGPTIDSLAFKIKVIDAFTNQPVANCLVGLYEGASDSIRPTYFVNTTKEGWAHFNYLKEGAYSVLAFEDKNKDLLLQKGERIAFKKEKTVLNDSLIDSLSTYIDSIPLRLFSPAPVATIRTFTYQPPAKFVVGATTSLRNCRFTLNNQAVESSLIEWITDDSLAIYTDIFDSSNVELIAASSDFSDTTSLRLTKAERSAKMTLKDNLNAGFLYPTDTLTISFTDLITAVDTSKMKLINSVDSLPIPLRSVFFAQNQVYFLFDKAKLLKAHLSLDPASVQSQHSSLSDSLIMPFQLKVEKDFGNIQLDASLYQVPVIVEVLLAGKVERSIPLDAVKKVNIAALLPGDYSFRVILDENRNKRWDTGNFESQLYPEVIHLFSETSKVRANWEVELILTPKP